MRITPALLALAIPMLAGGLSAQCIQIVASSNWTEPHRGTRFTPTTIAIQVPALSQADNICQVEFACYTRSTSVVSMPVWIYDQAPSGQPGTPIAAGTMDVGTSLGAYTAQVQAAVPAGQDFFIVFDNAVGNLAPPVALGGILGTHYHSGPPTWSGPYGSAAWMYRLYSSRGTLASSFTTTGEGCPGVFGTPLIRGIGSPVIGTTFRVGLDIAPIRTTAVHVFGIFPTQIDLGPAGAPGCILEQLPATTFAVTTTNNGASSFAYRLPNNPTLVGGQFFVQWAVLDSTANLLGLSLTKGGVVTIGDF